MADDDELAYLQPDFDLNSLTVPRLRNILVHHDISFPSSSKKGQLIETIETDLLPKAKKLLRERDRVRRTSRGITDIASQESTVDADEDDRDLMPPPPAPRTPRSRKSKSNLADAPTPSTSRRSKTPTSRKSTSKVRHSDTEPEEQPAPSTKRTRKSLPAPTPTAPHVRLEEPARIKREDGSSPFSDDNPFQGRSSPPMGSRRTSSSRPRKSTGRQSSSRRRETTSPNVKQEDDDHFHSRHYIPVSALQTDEHGVTTTEEFAPEAKRELEEAEANGELVPRRTQALVRRKRKPASTAAKASPVILLSTVLALIAGWYRQEKINIGYCDVGQPQWSLANNENVPAWVHENLQPTCEPCPPHAICYPNMEVKCENDFILQQHPLAANGLIPLPPTCEPDSEKEKRIKAVADKAIDELRQRRAAYECGDELPTVTHEAGALTKATETTLEISESALRAEVSKLRRRGMNADEFEDLWQSALGDIKSRDEVEITQDARGRVLLSSTSLARLPFTCALRRSAIRTLEAYRITLALLVLSALSVLYGRHRIITYKAATAQIPDLVAKALDKLATQAALKEDGRTGEAFISIRQLRDDILRHVLVTRERERVWESVKKIVEGNSNVRAGDRESARTGDLSRVWEWTGPVDLAPGLTGRQSGMIENSPAQNGQIKDMQMRKWDEGRPIY